MNAPGRSSAMVKASSMPFAAAVEAMTSRAPSTSLRMSKVSAASSTLPASIFEKSRMSLMIVRRASPLVLIVSA